MTLKNQLHTFYLLSFLGGLSFNIVAPLFVVFGLSVGLSIAQVGFLLGVNSLSILIFEVPTGIFADSCGRKKSILLSYTLSIFSALVYFLTSNFYLLLVGSIINGLALTFISGAFEAFVVDSLQLRNKEHLRNRTFIRLGIISTLGFIAGGFVGSSIAYFKLKYIWLLQSLIAASALIFSWKFLKEEFYPTEFTRKNYLRANLDKIKNCLVFILQKKTISSMFIIALLMALANAFYLISWPLVFKDTLSIPVYHFGIITSLAAIFYLAGSFTAERLTRQKGTTTILLLSLIMMAVLYLVFIFSKNIPLSLISFILIDFSNGVFNPLFYSLFNRFIPAPQRATLLSFYSLTERGASGMGEILAGKLMTLLALPLTMLVSPILVVMGLISLQRLNKQKPDR